MARKILLIPFLLIGFVSYSQTLQYINTYGYDYNKFKARDLLGLPNDTFTVPATLQDVKWIARKGTTTYFWNTTSFIWEASVSGVATASEGVSTSGSDVQLFGPLATPAQLTTERSINLRGNILHFNNRENQTTSGGVVWQFTDKAYSPYQFISKDTLSANEVDPPSAATPLSGVFARRTMYYADGILKTQKIYGHYFGQTYNWKDTMTFKTEGGDYNQGFTAEQSLEPRGTGKQATGIHGTGNQNNEWYGVPTFLSNTIFRSTLGSNYIKTSGWLIGISSYLVMGSGATDTCDRFSFYNTNNFLNPPTHVKKAFAFDMEHSLSGARIDSSFGIWDKWGYRHLFTGNTVFGPRYDSTSTGYNVKVNGAMYMRGLFQGFQGTDVASTAGVMTLPGSATAGNIYEITGTNTITAINNTNLKNGYEVTFLFTSTATLTDGTANSGAAIGIELAGNTNFVGSADDAVTLVLTEIGGTQRWREKCRSVN